MANLSSKTGYVPAQTQISLANGAATTVQEFGAYDAQEVTGHVFIDATSNYRAAIKLIILKNGAGTYSVAAEEVVGDTYLAAAIVSFSMTGSILSATLPSVAGFTSAYIRYTLSSLTMGGSFPLTIAGTSVVPNFGAQNIVTTGTLSTGNATVGTLASGAITTSGNLTYSGTTFTIGSNKSDASDTARLILNSGGAIDKTRGAFLQLYGNEFGSSVGGQSRFIAGDSADASGSNTAYEWQSSASTGAASAVVMSITGAGAVTMGSASSASNTHQYLSSGDVAVQAKSVGTANQSSFDLYHAATLRAGIKALPSTSALAIATGDLGIITNSQNIIFSADGTTRHMIMSTAGAVTLGPTSGATGSLSHSVNNGTTGNCSLDIKTGNTSGYSILSMIEGADAQQIRKAWGTNDLEFYHNSTLQAAVSSAGAWAFGKTTAGIPGTFKLNGAVAGSIIRLHREGSDEGSIYLNTYSSDFRVGTTDNGSELLSITSLGTTYLNPSTGNGIYTNVNRLFRCVGTSSIARPGTECASTDFTTSLINSSKVSITGSGNFNVHGIAVLNEGTVIFFHNNTASTMTVKHNSATEGTSAAKIFTRTSADVTFPPNTTAMFIYGTDRWQLIGA